MGFVLARHQAHSKFLERFCACFAVHTSTYIILNCLFLIFFIYFIYIFELVTSLIYMYIYFYIYVYRHPHIIAISLLQPLHSVSAVWTAVYSDPQPRCLITSSSLSSPGHYQLVTTQYIYSTLILSPCGIITLWPLNL